MAEFAGEGAKKKWDGDGADLEDSNMAGIGSDADKAARKAAARPKTMISKSELVPRRLAPCTETDAHSPIAMRPSQMASGLSAVGRNTSP